VSRVFCVHSVCLSVGNECVFRKNGRLDPDALWDGGLGGMMFYMGSRSPHGKGQIFGRNAVATNQAAVCDGECGGCKESCIRWMCTLAPPGKYS